MHTLKASLIYFLSVFCTGFALGFIRVSLLVPRLGVRWAELLELPLMLAASFFLARFAVRRFGPFAAVQRLAMGIIALLLMVAAELGVALPAQGLTFVQYWAGRDPISGTAYLLSLVAFAFMPLVAGHGQGSNNSFKPKPLRGSA
jgi:hypothetical protein